MKSDLKEKKHTLTKTFIDGLPLPEKTPVFIWDKDLKNFGIKLNPTSKVYVAQSRVNGKTRRVKIGEHGIFTVDQARKKAKQILLDMENGIDPNQQKKIQVINITTLEDVSVSYIKDRRLKPSSVNDIHKHLKGIFLPWKDQPITNITRDMVLTLFRKRSEESPAQANQGFRVLRALLNYAMETYRPGEIPIISENPVNVLSGAKIWNTIPAKKRRIPLNQVGQAVALIREIQNHPAQTLAGSSMVDAVFFALLTGARWGECQKLTWDNVNLEFNTWHIHDPKNKESVTLPLSSQATNMLKSRNRIKGNPFVFCSDKSKTGHIGPGRWITDQISEALKIKLSPHDLRRTFRSIAAELDIELWRTKLLMNHKMANDVTIGSYTEKADLEYLRPSIQKIGDWIERQGAIAAAGNIVDINSRKPA